MSQADAQRRVLSSLSDRNVLSPYGTARIQEKQGTAYIAIPSRLADFYGLEQGDEITRAFDPASSCLILPLADGADIFE